MQNNKFKSSKNHLQKTVFTTLFLSIFNINTLNVAIANSINNKNTKIKTVAVSGINTKTIDKNTAKVLEENTDIVTKYEYLYADFYVNDDATHTETYYWAKKILKEKAISYSKEETISYSTSTQKADVIEAYTKKADGRRIDVPKNNFQVQVNGGKGKDAPVFSDRTNLTVVFPDLAVGDTVVFKYKITQFEPLFPKHFSQIGSYYNSIAYDDVKTTINLPKSLSVQYSVNQMQEKTIEKDGRKIIELIFKNPKAFKNKRKDYSVYDIEQDMGFIISTFKSYEEIAKAYGERATPKAAVTARIQKLADEIINNSKINDKTDSNSKLVQITALHAWITKNITYAGNCIGTGAVVPHDIDFILDNKMGDCKDHATLLQALLSAIGIKSTQALINANSIYKLPKVPSPLVVNHVINYIPSLNLFIDSTIDDLPLQLLPYSMIEKPVLLVDNFQEGLKIPLIKVGYEQETTKTIINIQQDGSVKGEVKVKTQGRSAAGMRNYFKDMTNETKEKMVEKTLERYGYIGNGSFKMDNITSDTPLSDKNEYHATFEFKDFIQRPGTGAFKIDPVFFSSLPIYNLISSEIKDDEDEIPADEVICHSSLSKEEYVYNFPKNIKILSIPENANINEKYLSYKATYTLKNNTLNVVRILDSNTPYHVCPGNIDKLYKNFSKKVLQNLKMQVVYQ